MKNLGFFFPSATSLQMILVGRDVWEPLLSNLFPKRKWSRGLSVTVVSGLPSGGDSWSGLALQEHTSPQLQVLQRCTDE